MARKSIGSEEARARLPELLERAHRGDRVVITRHGKPYAGLVPVEEAAPKRRMAFMALQGTGAGLWGEGSAATVAGMRDEWE